MICKKPYQKRRTGIVNPVIVKGDAYRSEITPFACGQCLHCRINQSRIWQTRLLLESRDCIDSTFLTLTYDDDNVPWDYNLVKEDLTKFLKRYRKRLGHKIRYYAIGEYGEETWRPHFHLAIFSQHLLERCYMPCEDMRKRNFCTQDCIARLAWKKGNISLTAELSQELAGYITGYIKDKATKKQIINRVKEYGTMSRRPGIGFETVKRIADKFRSDPRSSSTVINSLSIGGRSRPIGGYLTKAFADQLSVSEHVWRDQFIKYSDELIDQYLKDGRILPEIDRQNKGKRDSQYSKHVKFRRKRKKL